MSLHGQMVPPWRTPLWGVPAAERPVTKPADVYRVGLTCFRLFARGRVVQLTAQTCGQVPAPLRDLMLRSLHGDPAARPVIGDWRLAAENAAAALPSAPLTASPGPARPAPARPAPARPTPVARPAPTFPRHARAPRPRRPAPATPPTSTPLRPWRADAASAGARLMALLTVATLVVMAPVSGALTFEPPSANDSAVLAAVARYLLPSLAIGLAAGWLGGVGFDRLVATTQAETWTRGRLLLHLLPVVGLACAVVLDAAVDGAGGRAYVAPEAWRVAALAPGAGVLLSLALRAAARWRVSRRSGLAGAGALAGLLVLTATAWPGPSVATPPGAAYEHLVESVPLGGCWPVSLEQGTPSLLRDSMTAKVICDEGRFSGTFQAFRNDQLMDVYVSQRMNRLRNARPESASHCLHAAGDRLYLAPWHRSLRPEEPLGTVLCHDSSAGATIEWSDERSRVYAIVRHPSRAALRRWWMRHEVTPSRG